MLRWDVGLPASILIMADAWERYWHWLGHDQRTGATTGAGVDAGARRPYGCSPPGCARFADAGTPWRTLRQAVATMASGLPSHRDMGAVVGANNW